MTKYVFTYHGGAHEMPETKEAQAEIMAAWGAWFGELGGSLVDGGNPFGPAVAVGPDGATSDGGVTPELNGYGIVNAADMDAAVALAKGCPVLASGGSVQVSECIEIEM